MEQAKVANGADEAEDLTVGARAANPPEDECCVLMERLPKNKRTASDDGTVSDDDIFAEPLPKKNRVDQQTPEQRRLKSRLDSMRIKTIRQCLHGIPPPPSLTNPRISIEEVAERLYEYFDEACAVATPAKLELSKLTITPEKVNFDIYYNDNLKCETLDYLYDKVRQRYVMNETSSFISTAPKFVAIESPLSCDILDMLPRSMSSPASPSPDTLSVELAQRRSRMRTASAQPLRRSPRKANVAIKNPNLRLNGLLAQRDAFMSKVPQQEPPAKVAKPTTKFITVPKQKCSSASGKDVPARKSEEKVPKLEELSETHRKKLVWATTMALKQTSSGLMEDSAFFKKCRSSLFRLCFVQWLKMPETKKGDSKPVKGTTDRMLDLATQLAPQVLNTMTGS